MKEKSPTHRLDVRVERWTKDGLREPGLEHPKISRTDFYRGSMPDCDLAALWADAPELTWDTPATLESPFDQRTYLSTTSDEGLIEVTCRGRLVKGDGSPWVNALPLASQVFVAYPPIKRNPDEEGRTPRPGVRLRPAPDGHLEDAYDLRQGEGFDFNEIEQGMYDDHPSPYGGTSSEE